MRCFPQKRCEQKPHSPTIGCATALQPSFVHRGLLDLRLVEVGVLVPELAADDVVLEEGAARDAVMSDDSGGDGV